jgi:hypothetical protein
MTLGAGRVACPPARMCGKYMGSRPCSRPPPWEPTDLNPTDAIGAYIAAIGRDASRPFLFLFDPNDLLAGLGDIDTWGRALRITRYRDPLSLRASLEGHRDAAGPDWQHPVAVVSIPPDAARMERVPDMTARAQCVEITPHALLRRLQPEYTWPPEIGMLRGADFWALADGLLSARAGWGDALTGATAPLLIAECAVGRELRAGAAAADPVEAWARVHDDTETRDILRRYPSALHAARHELLDAMPVASKLNHDPDFVVFLWTMYLVRKYAPKADAQLSDLFEGELWDKYVDYDDARLLATCTDMLAADPLAVVSQMRVAERAVSLDPVRADLFLRLLGLKGERRFEVARRIAATETLSGYVTEEALRILLPRVIADPEALSKTRARKIRSVLMRTHLANEYPQYFPRLTRSAAIYTKTVELVELVRRFKSRGWARTLVVQPIETWMDEVYPSCLAPMGVLHEELEALLSGGSSRFGRASESLMDETSAVLRDADRQFARVVDSGYIRWISRREPPPMMTVDFLDTVFLPEWREMVASSRNPLAVILLFHGLRWDEWSVLEPLLREKLPRHRAADTQPMLALLPTSRPYNTAALVLGRFPALGDAGQAGALLSERLAPEGVPVAGAVSPPRLSMEGVERGALLANISLAEVGAAKTRPTGAAREAIVALARVRLGAFLAAIPSRATVFAISNGGTTQITGPGARVQPKPMETQARWVGLGEAAPKAGMPDDVAYFNASALRLPNPAVTRCAFAYPGAWFSDGGREAATQHLNGGISLAEMVVPCAVFRSRRRRTPRLEAASGSAGAGP